MLKRIAVGIVSICLAGTCGAAGQSERLAAGVVQGTQGGHADTDRANTARRTETGLTEVGPSNAGLSKIADETLPDAPSAARTNPGEPFHQGGVAEVVHGAIGTSNGTLMEGEGFRAAPPPDLAFAYKSEREPKESSGFFAKYLERPRSDQGSRYLASAKESLLGRATDAASRVFVTRDETGKPRVNTSYFVAVLTMVAAHRAERPYWARSNSAPLGDFGSTVGNDAGMNLLHEFGPELRQAVTDHMPGFVARIEERVVRGLQAPARPSGPVR